MFFIVKECEWVAFWSVIHSLWAEFLRFPVCLRMCVMQFRRYWSTKANGLNFYYHILSFAFCSLQVIHRSSISCLAFACHCAISNWERNTSSSCLSVRFILAHSIWSLYISFCQTLARLHTSLFEWTLFSAPFSHEMTQLLGLHLKVSLIFVFKCRHRP